jgi:hypothetical protein
MVRGALVCLGTLFLSAFAIAETLLTTAKIVSITERGMVLMVGTEPLAVEDGPDTRWWKGKTVVKRDAFKEGDAVHARIKTDADPPILRELADKATWDWLDANRRQPRSGTIEKIDSKYLTLKLSDGSTFAYRATEKSQVKLKGRDADLSDLEAGMKVYAQGRTLANLDTWLVMITDEPIPGKETKASAKKEKIAPLPSTGTIEGKTLSDFPKINMFDMLHGVRTLHITYNLKTQWFLDGKPAKHSAFQRDLAVIVTYRRDKAGRIIAIKVELFRRT